MLMSARLAGMMMLLVRSAMAGHRRRSRKECADIAAGKTLRTGGKSQNQTQRENFESQRHSVSGNAALIYYSKAALDNRGGGYIIKSGNYEADRKRSGQCALRLFA